MPLMFTPGATGLSDTTGTTASQADQLHEFGFPWAGNKPCPSAHSPGRQFHPPCPESWRSPCRNGRCARLGSCPASIPAATQLRGCSPRSAEPSTSLKSCWTSLLSILGSSAGAKTGARCYGKWRNLGVMVLGPPSLQQKRGRRTVSPSVGILSRSELSAPSPGVAGFSVSPRSGESFGSSAPVRKNQEMSSAPRGPSRGRPHHWKSLGPPARPRHAGALCAPLYGHQHHVTDAATGNHRVQPSLERTPPHTIEFHLHGCGRPMPRGGLGCWGSQRRPQASPRSSAFASSLPSSSGAAALPSVLSSPAGYPRIQRAGSGPPNPQHPPTPLNGNGSPPQTLAFSNEPQCPQQLLTMRVPPQPQ